MKPLVTVYITNHNYGKFISKSIESVLKQTYQKFQLIIIDDGSTDNSFKLIQQYYKRNKDIIILKQKKRGLVASNNIAINLAKGKYIIRLDADDWLHKNALKEMVSIIDKKPKVEKTPNNIQSIFLFKFKPLQKKYTDSAQKGSWLTFTLNSGVVKL